MLPSARVHPRSDSDWQDLLKTAPLGIIPGDPAEILEQGRWVAAMLRERGIVKEGDRLLDLGCGIGRIAIALSAMSIRYDGIDIVPDCIRFCRSAFENWSHFVFKILRVRNRKYRKDAFWSPRYVRLPYPKKTFDSALAISVFTHIGDPLARDRYIAEIARVLKDDGQALFTWFRSPPNAVSNDDERTVFEEGDIKSALGKHFEIVEDWGGTTEAHHDQWVTHLKKKTKRAG